MTRTIEREEKSVWRGIHPLHDNVLVKRDKPMEMIGRVALPEAAQQKSSKGTVLAVGAGRQNDDLGTTPVEVAGSYGHDIIKKSSDGRTIVEVARMEMSVKVGDRVQFTNHGGYDFLYKGEMFVMLTNEHILAVLEGSGDELEV